MSITDYINFYGLNFPLRYKSKENFLTFIGLFLTIFSIVLFIFFFYVIIFDDNFTIYTKIVDNSPLEKINLNTSYIMIGIVDTNGVPFDINNNYINLEINLISVHHIVDNISYLINVSKNITNVNLKNCNDYKIYNKINYKNFLCFNNDIFVNGIYFDVINDYSYLDIEIKKCNKNKNCVNDIEEIYSFFQNKYLSIYYIDYKPNYFDNKVPIKKIIYNDFIPFSSLFTQKYIYQLILSKYIIDGKFNKKKYKFLQLEKNLNFNEQKLNSNSNFFEIILTASKQKKIYIKKDIKIIDIFYKLGGFLYFFIKIFKFINRYFDYKYFLIDFINNLITDDYKKKLNFQQNIFKKFNYQNPINKSLNDNQISSIEPLPFDKNNIGKIKSVSKSPKLPKLQLKELSKHHYSNDRSIYHFIHQFRYPKQSFSIPFYYYFIPFFLIKKMKKYQTLIIYENIYQSYMSIDLIIPYIEKLRKIYKEIIEKLNIIINLEIFKLK